MSGARRTVKRVDRGMFFRGEHESKQIEILLLPIRMHRLGDDDRAIFDMPTQNHLRRGNPMLRCDALNRTIPAFKSAPRAIGEYASTAMPCALQ